MSAWFLPLSPPSLPPCSAIGLRLAFLRFLCRTPSQVCGIKWSSRSRFDSGCSDLSVLLVSELGGSSYQKQAEGSEG